MQSAAEGKQRYSTPRLMVHGTLEEVTLSCTDKGYGAGDGVILAGIGAVAWNCPAVS